MVNVNITNSYVFSSYISIFSYLSLLVYPNNNNLMLFLQTFRPFIISGSVLNHEILQKSACGEPWPLSHLYAALLLEWNAGLRGSRASAEPQLHVLSLALLMTFWFARSSRGISSSFLKVWDFNAIGALRSISQRGRRGQRRGWRPSLIRNIHQKARSLTFQR